ncbi:hypothetical protein MMC22_006107 [Lobaria immixta]|nr:hypothetical protein [Lobaria immixta]
MPRVTANAVEEAAARGDQAFFRQLEAIVEDSARHISASMFSANGGSRNLDEMTREILAEVPVSLHKRIAIVVYNALVVAIDHVPMKEVMSWALGSPATPWLPAGARGFMGYRMADELWRSGGRPEPMRLPGRPIAAL